jgi:hypothetical protein
MFCLLSVFVCCFCLHITEYEQIGGGGGGQNFLGPRGVKYLNTGLTTANRMIPWYSFVLKLSFSRWIWTYYTLCIFRCTVSIQQVNENGNILGARYLWENMVLLLTPTNTNCLFFLFFKMLICYLFMCLQLAVRRKNLPDPGFLQRETG